MLTRQPTMTRFRCGHCGVRLVMHTRHLRRVVACHECGHATHPVAKRLQPSQQMAQKGAAARIAGRAAGGSKKAPTAAVKKPAMEKAAQRTADCANCGDAFGKLETPRAWKGQVVCQLCHAKLTAEPVRPAAPAKPLFSVPPPAASMMERRPATAAGPVTPAPGLELSLAPLAPAILIGVTGLSFFLVLSVMSYVGGFLSALALVAIAAVGLRWIKRGTLSVRDRLDQIESIRVRHGMLRVVAMLFAWLWSQPGGRKVWAAFLVLFWGVLYLPYSISGILLPVPHGRVITVRARA